MRDSDRTVLIRDLRHLADFLEDQGRAADQIERDVGSRGFPTQTLGEGGGKGGLPGSSTERAALQGPDRAQLVVMARKSALKMLRRGLQEYTRLSKGLVTKAELKGRENSGATCEGCKAHIACVGENRIVSGLGPACYRKWNRDNTRSVDPIPRSAWMHDRLQAVQDGEAKGCGA